jgi:hypothetical protein
MCLIAMGCINFLANSMSALDFVIIGNQIIVATINGLLSSPKDAINWEQVLRPSGKTFDAVSSLRIVQDGVDGTQAQVYLLNSDSSDNCQYYRLFASGTHATVDPQRFNSNLQNDYVVSLGRVRDYCFTNGTFVWHARSLDNRATDMLSFFPLGTSSYQMHALDQNIYLKNDLQKEYTIGGMTFDSAFGGYVLAGPWGVKIYG